MYIFLILKGPSLLLPQPFNATAAQCFYDNSISAHTLVWHPQPWLPRIPPPPDFPAPPLKFSSPPPQNEIVPSNLIYKQSCGQHTKRINLCQTFVRRLHFRPLTYSHYIFLFRWKRKFIYSDFLTTFVHICVYLSAKVLAQPLWRSPFFFTFFLPQLATFSLQIFFMCHDMFKTGSKGCKTTA